MLTASNVSMLSLNNVRLLDSDQTQVGIYRMVIAVCQLAGSVLCLAVIDFIERKVSMKTDTDMKVE